MTLESFISGRWMIICVRYEWWLSEFDVALCELLDAWAMLTVALLSSLRLIRLLFLSFYFSLAY